MQIPDRKFVKSIKEILDNITIKFEMAKHAESLNGEVRLLKEIRAYLEDIIDQAHQSYDTVEKRLLRINNM